jgi:hypothetical protein
VTAPNSSSVLAAGDRVFVTDQALANLREIMRKATGTEPAPNHHGSVLEVWADGDVLICFDDGAAAPYPADLVRHLPADQDREVDQ